ncbi:acetylornithine deacetylase [Flavilitoribacter nigricans DSM 23189 = NBRC 102662]|uniref:Acetylornithine deacetylase n=2 Tax=Flavilitoribacter TaxID=2762562 RepID=A0A2D0N920_FLAN2|nr:acetylornithine deacetylase [Flavilitoribacter nigricans DSM 23189 = NBRC 102662]
MRVLRYTALFCSFFFFGSELIAQSAKADRWIAKKLPEIITEHRALVSLPNVPSRPEDMDRNAEWLRDAFEKRGFKFDILATETIPVLFAESAVDADLPTVLFYFHYDGQPVDPTAWDQDSPFVPVLKHQDEAGKWQMLEWEKTTGTIDPDWRIFGRSAADDKGPIMMFLSAVDFLRETGGKPAFNVKVIMDGEEESGSSGLLSTLEQHRERYAADHLIIMDGPAHPSNRPTLTFGCRGITGATLTVYGPRLAQHSGHFGNYAPNPVFRMAQLLATMKDEAGRVLIDGFYEGVEWDAETAAIMAAVPDDAREINDRLGVAVPEAVGRNYQESLQYPSLNIRGLTSGWTGEQTRTIVPDRAVAEIGIRLVVETDGERQLKLLRRHIEAQGYYLTDRDPTDDERQEHPKIAAFVSRKPVRAFRTELDSPTGKWLRQALEDAFGQAPVNIRTMGGTVPVTPMIEGLGVPAVIVPMVNMDNNQHSPNENLRLGNLVTGIKTCLAILSTPIP